MNPPLPFRLTSLAPDDCAGDAARLLARVAIARGAQTVAEVREFLAPLPQLRNPWQETCPHLLRAWQRIARAVQARELILVWGDYDVDGITSLVQLVTFLRQLGANVQWFVPNRQHDDYGLTLEAAERKYAELKPRLVVTVDCGTSSSRAIDYLATQSCDVIVIDHHPGEIETLPDSAVLLNPHHVPDSPPDLRQSSAAGLVFWLTQHWARLSGHQFDSAFTSRQTVMAGLGTLVDVMPLTGSNRSLVKQSLHLINQPHVRQSFLGLRIILGHQPATAWTYAFHLGPVLNASGRLIDASGVVEMLLSNDTARVEHLARIALELNADRQALQNRIIEEATADAMAEVQKTGRDRVLVVARSHWHTGIVGIVASKLRETFNRPCIVLGAGSSGTWKGSGRSLPEFDLGSAIANCVQAGVALGGGGHRMAAGVRVALDRLDDFRSHINLACSLPPDAFLPRYETIPASPRMIERDWAEFYSALEPYGPGHPRPLVLVRRARMHGYSGPTGKLVIEDVDTGATFPVVLENRERAPSWVTQKDCTFMTLLRLRRCAIRGSRQASLLPHQSFEWVVQAAAAVPSSVSDKTRAALATPLNA